jgi:hypothetical protein
MKSHLNCGLVNVTSFGREDSTSGKRNNDGRMMKNKH